MRSLIGSLAVVLCSVVAVTGCGDSGSSSTTGGSDTGAGGAGGEAIGGNGGNGGTGATGPVGGNGGAGGGLVAPPEWTCDPVWYAEVANGAAEQYCDCECGALDPDCEIEPALPIGDCYEGQTCDFAAFQCEGSPTDWTCDDTEFDGGAGNGCDCNCGAPDPDCALDPVETVEGCEAGDSCTPGGVCVPAAWTCDPTYFADGFCDCGCAVADPDCADALVATCEYCDNDGSCSAEECPGTINPTDNSTCTTP